MGLFKLGGKLGKLKHDEPDAWNLGGYAAAEWCKETVEDTGGAMPDDPRFEMGSQLLVTLGKNPEMARQLATELLSKEVFPRYQAHVQRMHQRGPTERELEAFGTAFGIALIDATRQFAKRFG